MFCNLFITRLLRNDKCWWYLILSSVNRKQKLRKTQDWTETLLYKPEPPVEGGVVASDWHSTLHTAPVLCFFLLVMKDTFRNLEVVLTSGLFVLQYLCKILGFKVFNRKSLTILTSYCPVPGSSFCPLSLNTWLSCWQCRTLSRKIWS